MTRAAGQAACSSRPRSSSSPTAGRRDDIAVYGQESNERTWRLATMNLAIHGISGDLSTRWEDTFREDKHPDVKADFILANPPFNMSDWARKTDDPRWRYGVPPAGNANFAWLQHMIYKLAERGTAGVVLANGSMSSQQSGEGEIRAAMVEADLVACMIALPPQLFRTTQIPACLWFLAKDKCPQGAKSAGRPPRRSPLHRRPLHGHPGQPHRTRLHRRGDRPDRGHLPRLARNAVGPSSELEVRGCPRLLLLSHHRGNPRNTLTCLTPVAMSVSPQIDAEDGERPSRQD